MNKQMMENNQKKLDKNQYMRRSTEICSTRGPGGQQKKMKKIP